MIGARTKGDSPDMQRAIWTRLTTLFQTVKPGRISSVPKSVEGESLAGVGYEVKASARQRDHTIGLLRVGVGPGDWNAHQIDGENDCVARAGAGICR
jgi:hypothetical protein